MMWRLKSLLFSLFFCFSVFNLLASDVYYEVKKLNLSYVNEEETLPDLACLDDLELEEAGRKISLTELRQGKSVQKFSAISLQTLLQEIVTVFHEKDFLGAYVSVDTKQVSREGVDLRKKGNLDLDVKIHLERIAKVNTIALGGRFDEFESLNHPSHAFILKNSPVRGGGKDLLRKKQIDDYMYRLSRHPGRRVEAQVTGSKDDKGLNLDYLVKENKPIMAYVNGSNTGTSGTRNWVERIGLAHYQFTGKDDLFFLEYTTIAFDELHAVSLRYQRPLSFDPSVRFGFRGAWNEFIASQFALLEEEFVGRQNIVGIDLEKNVFQWGESFIDIAFALNWRHIFVHNKLQLLEPGKEQFLLPSGTIRLDYKNEGFKVKASATVMANLSGLANTTEDELRLLGRETQDNSWTLFKWAVKISTILNQDKLLRDREKNEFTFKTAGQIVPSARVVPQFETVIGGRNTVRGYPQSIAVGDTAFWIQCEYLKHHIFDRKGWKGTGRVFLDSGRTIINHANLVETNKTLVGAGLGLDLRLKNFLKVSADWGFALKNIVATNDRPTAGNQELHISLSIIF